MSNEDLIKELPTLVSLKGLGETTVQKLNAHGINNIIDLSVANAVDVARLMNKSTDAAMALVLDARGILRKCGRAGSSVMNIEDLHEREKMKKVISTTVPQLDSILGGGIHTMEITEFYGEFGSGKSQICFTMAVLATRPEEEGGLGGNVLYIDTEGTLTSERMIEIINERKLDPATIRKIHRMRPESSGLFELDIENISETIVSNEIKMVVVDSIIHLHRQEYPGRENLPVRQQKLAKIMNKLLKVAESYNIAIIITNQIIDDPGVNPLFGGSPIHATGGNVIAHASTTRLYIDKLKSRMKVKVMDSPKLEGAEGYFTIGKKGIEEYKDKITKPAN